MTEYDLDELLAQVRRIEEHREKGAERKIRDAYQNILKELRHYLADVYSKYAEDDQLNYELLQKHSYYARFLEEVEQKINELSPDTKRLIRSTVEQAYEYTYNGMIDCAKKSGAIPEIAKNLKGCTAEILRRAVENPISKLTLNDRLEKHRKEIVYDIKQNISVGLLNGDRYSTMAKRIKNSVEGDYKKAIRISRTETHRVREAGNLDAAESVQMAMNSGGVPLQMMKIWKTMRDERVRPAKQKGKNKQYDHRKMEGISVPINEEFTLPSGAKTMAPGQSGVAGEDINCRCYLSYEIRQQEENYFYYEETDFKLLEKRFESDTIKAESLLVKSQKIVGKSKKAEIINEAIRAPEPFYAEDLRQAYKTTGVKKEGNFYDVLIHGAPHFVEYEHTYILDTEMLYYIISGRKDYHAENIRLLSCSTGKEDQYGNCVAQKLANLLGVDVYAPTDILKIHSDGHLSVGMHSEGCFKLFHPKKKGKK